MTKSALGAQALSNNSIFRSSLIAEPTCSPMSIPEEVECLDELAVEKSRLLLVIMSIDFVLGPAVHAFAKFNSVTPS
jgi:hypothetical protein